LPLAGPSIRYSAFFNISRESDGIGVDDGGGVDVGSGVDVAVGKAVGDGIGVGVGAAPHALVTIASASSALRTVYFFMQTPFSAKARERRSACVIAQKTKCAKSSYVKIKKSKGAGFSILRRSIGEKPSASKMGDRRPSW
jgi:hypothetical protein